MITKGNISMIPTQKRPIANDCDAEKQANGKPPLLPEFSASFVGAALAAIPGQSFVL